MTCTSLPGSPGPWGPGRGPRGCRDVGPGVLSVQAASSARRQPRGAREVAVEVLVGALRAVGDAWTSRSPPTKAPFHEAPSPPNTSSRSPRLRGLLIPTLNAWSCSATRAPKSGRRWRCSPPGSRCWRSWPPAARTRCRRRPPSRAGRTARRGAATTTPEAAARRPGRRRPRCPGRRGTARRRPSPGKRDAAAADRLVQLGTQVGGLGRRGSPDRSRARAGDRPGARRPADGRSGPP